MKKLYSETRTQIKQDNETVNRRRKGKSEYLSNERVIENVIFSMMTIIVELSENSKFVNCNFINCRFDRVEFKNITFSFCEFSIIDFINCSSDLSGLSFIACKFSIVKFNDSNFIMAFVCDSLFYNVKFQNTDLRNAIFDRCAFYKTIFIDNCRLEGTMFLHFINRLDIKFQNDTSYTKVDIVTVFGDFLKSDKFWEPVFEDFNNIRTHNREISQTYSEFSRISMINSQKQKTADLMYISQEYKRRSMNPINKKLYLIAKYTCGYGEYWTYSVYSSIFFILFFAVIYLFLGLQISNSLLIKNEHFSQNINIIHYPNLLCILNSLPLYIYDYGISFYYSMMTFTTVGYGNINTISYFGMLISSIEMFIGGIMMAVMVGTLMRNLTR